MRKLTLLVAAVVVLLPAVAAAEVPFPRAANSVPGRAVFESGPVRVRNLDRADRWTYRGQDILPFDYEQGVDFTGPGLVFSSRGSLHRTTPGCPSPEDTTVPCYDEVARNQLAIPGELFREGIAHIGDITVGRRGPAKGFVFAPLEDSVGDKTIRAYLAYDVATLEEAGSLVERTPHSFHSWVTVDPSGRWMVAADGPVRTLRLHSIASRAGRVVMRRTTAFDVKLASKQPPPNFNGCAFRDDRTIYCSEWKHTEDDRDINTEIYRIDLPRALGSRGMRGTVKRVMDITLTPKGPGGVPFGMETEGVTFYRRTPRGPLELHVLIRGEALGWTYLLHLARR